MGYLRIRTPNTKFPVFEDFNSVPSLSCLMIDADFYRIERSISFQLGSRIADRFGRIHTRIRCGSFMMILTLFLRSNCLMVDVDLYRMRQSVYLQLKSFCYNIVVCHLFTSVQFFDQKNQVCAGAQLFRQKNLS